MFGSLDEVIAKLKRYRDLGVDNVIYYETYGLPLELQKKSLELFITEVLPEFAEAKGVYLRTAADWAPQRPRSWLRFKPRRNAPWERGKRLDGHAEGGRSDRWDWGAS